jgi:hypothetical protein
MRCDMAMINLKMHTAANAAVRSAG